MTTSIHPREDATTDGIKKRYIDLRYDIGFKIALANPDKPELMLGLLQALIPERAIKSIRFMNTESSPEEIEDKRVIYDIRCIEESGDSFVVEMQKSYYHYIYDRLVIYSGDPLKRMLKAGQGYETIRPLYIICIADFFLNIPGDTDQERKNIVRRACPMMTDTKKVLSDKLNFVFLQLPAVEALTKGQTFLEKFAYVISHIESMQQIPEELKGDEYFETLFNMAERRYINKEQLKIYDNMIRDEIQIQAEKDWVKTQALKEGLRIGLQEGEAQGLKKGIEKGESQGLEKGRVEGKIAEQQRIAKELKAAGITTDIISKTTGLSTDEIDKL